MNLEIDKLEELTSARRKAWERLQQALGAENAVSDMMFRCREAREEACAADERAARDLYEYVHENTLQPTLKKPEDSNG